MQFKKIFSFKSSEKLIAEMDISGMDFSPEAKYENRKGYREDVHNTSNSNRGINDVLETLKFTNLKKAFFRKQKQ